MPTAKRRRRATFSVSRDFGALGFIEKQLIMHACESLLQATLAAADLGHALVLSGQLDQGLVVLEQAIPAIEAIRGDQHYDLGQPLSYFGRTLAPLGQFDAARAVYERDIEMM